MSFLVAGAACLLATSCGTVGAGSASSSAGDDVLNGVIGVLNNANTIGDVISSVIGSNKLTKSQLYGTWKYNGPGCAFTSNSALAKAGGEVVASQIKAKLKEDYNKVGFTSRNTQITFNKDNTFTAYVDGKKFSGNYTYDESTNALRLTGLLLSLNGYVTRNSQGVAILFESKKLLTLIQTMATMSGNATLSSIGEISKNYNGVRLGFDMAK
uniref:DUF4923 family protein n=1 Tax=Prevotella sp. TaxID=59823 RepID=UPI00402588C9